MGDATLNTAKMERVIRALAAAGKTLRLYPAVSPIPRQAVDSAIAAIESVFEDGAGQLSLVVARQGFLSADEQLCTDVTGVEDLLAQLRLHGVAGLSVVPGVTSEEMLTLLSALMLPNDNEGDSGRLSEVLQHEAVAHIHVTEVQLTVVDPAQQAAENQDTDEFLRDLAGDAGRLAAWFAGAAAGDPRSFEESLMELVRVSGPSGFATLLQSLASAFIAQEPDSKDVLIGLALDDGPTRDLTGAMFALLSANEIAAAVLGGNFGRNMLSLSNALTRLPLDKVTAEVRAEVQSMLPLAGHSAKEAEFLGHMIEVREQVAEEQALPERDGTYAAVIEAAQLPPETVDGARASIEESKRYVTAAGVRTMLALIQQQQDFALYCTGMESLAAMVPVLIEQQDLDLARTVLQEIARREQTQSAEWPELPERVDAALAKATSERTMTALVRTLVAEPSLVDAGRDFVRLTRGAGNDCLVTAAVELKAPGLAVAERLLGGRFEEELARVAVGTQWHLLAPVAARLGAYNSPMARKSLGALLSRSDEQSRRETVNGLGDAGSKLAVALLGRALSDESVEVQLAAARALAKSGKPAAAQLIAARLGEIDIDNDDFDVVTELIGALAALPGPVADETLVKLASRRSFMKRARHGEIQDLVNRARAYRAQAGGAA